MPDRQIRLLRELAHLDVDAVGAYDAAIARIHDSDIVERLREFRLDHLRHLQDLNTQLLRLGAGGVEFKSDFKGALLKGFTTVTSLMGTEAALFAMLGNEQLCTHSYHSALKTHVDHSVQLLIERHFQDEERHLGWIRDALRERLWETRRGEVHP